MLPKSEGFLTVSSGKSLFSSITSSSDPQKKEEEMEEENWPVKSNWLIMGQETEQNDVG